MTDDSKDAATAHANREQASIRELEAGRLPLAAQDRLATVTGDHAFTSDLSVAEHHAIRSVGFRPVGQVLGCCVYRIAYTGMWDCGLRASGLGGGFGGGGFGGGLGGGIGGYNAAYASAQTTEATPLRRALLEAKRSAVARMELEAQALGADGVVAVRFSERAVQQWTVEFEAIGTAVRSVGATHATRPFTSDLTGQDFSLLLRGGWAPTGLIFGVGAVARHDDFRTRSAARSWSNVEIEGYTDLLHEARSTARFHLARDAAATGAEGLVLQTATTNLGEHECQLTEGHDHVAQTHLVGTGVVHVPHTGPRTSTSALTVMPLRDPRTRGGPHAHRPGAAR
jgi:uncharacterized protein YbjQ (UPF0145 family)